MAFALLQLQSNKHINLVTLGIGGNDLLLLEQQCAPPQIFAVCVAANLQQVLTSYGSNLAQILSTVRFQANYKGTLVLVTTYSPSADPLFISVVQALNSVMTTVGLQFGVTFADGFLAFQIASALHGADPCKAGLLIQLSPGICDVHPSPAGRDLLAATVLFAIGDTPGQNGDNQSQNGDNQSQN
jgi:lysophospholipase L1-like esterase